MHELSIARSIAEIVCGFVEPTDRDRIRSIHVDVGVMSGVVPDSLEFCFEAVSEEYALPRHSLAINRVPFRCSCGNCSHKFSNQTGIVVCPVCGSSDTAVCSGRELHVATIDIDDGAKGIS